jgi:SAM-dependent methyltransferase
MSWRELSADPNDAAVLRERQNMLDRVTAPAPADRFALIASLASGRRVLDIGCADHELSASTNPSWLHRRLVEIGREVIGADINADSVDELRGQGFDVHHVDVLDGPGPLMDLDPFEVVVAGEIIEHLRDPLRLLELAHAVLVPGGRLVVTTPNPFAPHRTFAGRSRFAWENADHLFYAFPSGMAEMADRSGFELSVVTTTQWDDRGLVAKQSLYHWRRALLGRNVRRSKPRRPTFHRYVPFLEVAATWRLWRWSMMGETAIYVLDKR